MSPRPDFNKDGKKLSLKENMASYQRLLKSMHRYLPALIIAIILILGTVIISIYAPQIVSDLTNHITEHATTKDIDMNEVMRFGIILGSMYVGSAICSYFASFIISTVTQRYANNLRKEIVSKINRMKLAYFDGNQIGDILSRVTNDVDSLSQSIDTAVSSIISAIFTLIGALIGMFCTSWQMALTAMASVPLLLIFMVVIVKFAMPQFLKRQNEVGLVQGEVEEKFSGQIVIKLFNAEDSKNAQFDKKNISLGKTMMKAQIYGGLLMPISSFISYICYGLVIVVGGLLIANKVPGITIGTISAFLIYVRLFQQPFTQLSQAVNTLQTAGAASKRVFDFLGEEEMDTEAGKERKLQQNGSESIDGYVDFNNVCFSYDPSREIIHDFSAKIKPGMKVAIVGPTGAGKTTLVNLLMRFYEINSGSISIDSVSTTDMPRSEIHDIFGMVLQDTWVFEGTLRENLVYNTPGVSEEEINEVLKEVKLDYYVSTLPGGLDYVIKDASSISSGQRQLITIARAMLKKSPLLILDEATSNVDTRTEEVIQEAMDNLTKGKTSFVIAHRLSTIRNADMILVMRDGNIVEQGTHDELMDQDGFYASLYNSQFAFE